MRVRVRVRLRLRGQVRVRVTSRASASWATMCRRGYGYVTSRASASWATMWVRREILSVRTWHHGIGFRAVHTLAAQGLRRVIWGMAGGVYGFRESTGDPGGLHGFSGAKEIQEGCRG